MSRFSFTMSANWFGLLFFSRTRKLPTAASEASALASTLTCSRDAPAWNQLESSETGSTWWLCSAAAAARFVSRGISSRGDLRPAFGDGDGCAAVTASFWALSAPSALRDGVSIPSSNRLDAFEIRPDSRPYLQGGGWRGGRMYVFPTRGTKGQG